jgi:hypothetical protein
MLLVLGKIRIRLLVEKLTKIPIPEQIRTVTSFIRQSLELREGDSSQSQLQFMLLYFFLCSHVCFICLKKLQIAHSLWPFGILRFLPISIKSLCSLSLNFVKISLTFLSGCDKWYSISFSFCFKNLYKYIFALIWTHFVTLVLENRVIIYK